MTNLLGSIRLAAYAFPLIAALVAVPFFYRQVRARCFNWVRTVFGGLFLFYVLCVLAAVYMYRTRMGLNLKAVGENTAAADASGINVMLYKYVHVLIGGARAGLGGAYLSIVRIPLWQEDVVNGRGWIAVALVIFVAWNPIKAFFGAIVFGGLSIMGLRLQVMGVGISQYLFDMVPYLATIIIVIFSTHKKRKESQPPADLSNNYFREER